MKLVKTLRKVFIAAFPSLLKQRLFGELRFWPLNNNYWEDSWERNARGEKELDTFDG